MSGQYLDHRYLSVVLSISALFIWIMILLSTLFTNYVTAGKNVWKDFEHAPDGSWCERDREENFVKEPMNSFSDFSYLAVGLFMTSSGLFDLMFMIRNENKIVSNGKISLFFGIANIFHACGTFTNHSCRCVFGWRWDVMGMYAIIIQVMIYAWYLLVPYIKRRDSFSSFLVIYAILMVLCYYSTYITFISALRVSEIILFIAIPLTFVGLFRYYKRVRGKGLNIKLLVLSIVCLLIGWTCWNLDYHKILCYPDSIFQGHALWHIFTALTLLFIYVYFRTENFNSLTETYGFEKNKKQL
eukprot:TRINITY_DN467_c3_g1_i1.p1 TRINITY_DN467_c3_g1~~TRINITY_DN467_c3_g1_i1.p1  ORF type:complete len:299 (+),score=34.16 TRINITY_DN467_c3_g1_i1:39-935(+)